MMKKKSIGSVLIILGVLAFLAKVIEPFIVTKGCFGFEYLYEILSFGIPLFLIALGFRILRSSWTQNNNQ